MDSRKRAHTCALRFQDRWRRTLSMPVNHACKLTVQIRRGAFHFAKRNFRFKIPETFRANFFHQGEELRFQFQICNVNSRPKNSSDGTRSQRNGKLVFRWYGNFRSKKKWSNADRRSPVCSGNFRLTRSFYLYFNWMSRKFWLNEKVPIGKAFSASQLDNLCNSGERKRSSTSFKVRLARTQICFVGYHALVTRRVRA